MEIKGLDRIDNRIADLLTKNARLSLSEIGKEVGLSRVSVKKRIEQMERSGLIRGYHAQLDPIALPKGIRFTLDIEAAPGYYADVIGVLAGSSMLHQIYGTSGESHIHAMGVAPNNETLGTYAGYIYRTVKGIRKLNWQILVTTYKDTERGVEYVRYEEREDMEAGGTGRPEPERDPGR